MFKRTLSPAYLPAAKRLRTSAGLSNSFCGRSSSLDDSLLSDELVLCIFSYLSWVDLCAVQATNRNWCRLAADNELWRKLYLTVYGRSRLRGASGFLARSDGKDMKPLPGGAKPAVYKDWKWMFRISSNWRRGACYRTVLRTALQLLRRGR
jgi:F-box-like